MMFFDTHETNLSKIIRARAQLLVATRDLLMADAEMMDDMGNSGCDYCKGGDDDVPDGHDLECPFASAFEIVLQERAQGEEAIKEEAKAIRDALVYLVSADFQLMGTQSPCMYCDDVYSHEEDCVFDAAIDTLVRIPRANFE